MHNGYVKFGNDGNFRHWIESVYSIKVDKLNDYLVPYDVSCSKHKHYGWSLVNFTCDACGFEDHGDYVVSTTHQDPMLMYFEETAYKVIMEGSLNAPLSPLLYLRDKSRYLQMYEHQLHLKYIRYRFDHYWCSMDIDYTGMDLLPVVDRIDFKIFTSNSGYKIFLVDYLKVDFEEIHKWVVDHPIVIFNKIEVPVITATQDNGEILAEIRRNPLLLKDRATLKKLVYLYKLGDKTVNGYIKQALYMQYGQRTGTRGVILEGTPGLGKSYDLVNSLDDVYWMPYAPKTKNYYDGYIGQTNLIIDDLGHYTPDEWKILIRLVNDAPWTLPMANAQNKDLISNVSQNIVVTTNCISSLEEMKKETRDAICRRFDCYRYLDGDNVMYRRYNINIGKYEDVYVLNRSEFRLRLKMWSSTFEVASDGYEVFYGSQVIPVLCDVLRFFNLPTFRETLMSFSHIFKTVVPYDNNVLPILIEKATPVLLDLFDWGRLQMDQKRTLRYLKKVTGREFPIADYTGVDSLDKAIAVAEAKLCGREFSSNMSEIYDKEPCVIKVVTPSYVVPQKNFDDIPQYIQRQYSVDFTTFNSQEVIVPEQVKYVKGYRFNKKSNLKEHELFEDTYNTVQYPYNEFSPRFKSKYVIEKDESEYKPYFSSSSKLNMREINQLFHVRNGKSKTQKRREQRNKKKRDLIQLSIEA